MAGLAPAIFMAVRNVAAELPGPAVTSAFAPAFAGLLCSSASIFAAKDRHVPP